MVGAPLATALQEIGKGRKRKAASVGGTEAAYERSGGLTATEREKKPIASLTRG
jgi:hypothetical protein